MGRDSGARWYKMHKLRSVVGEMDEPSSLV